MSDLPPTPTARAMRKTRAALLAVVLGLPVAAVAGESSGVTSFDGSNPRVAARLLVHPDDLGRRTVRVALRLEMDPGWHVYAPDPGDTGLPTVVAWSAPGGSVEAGAWPEPKTWVELDGDLVSYGYDDTLWLPATVRFGPEPAASGRSLEAAVELLACREECIPGSLVLGQDFDPPGAREAEETRALFAAGGAGTSDAPPRIGLLRAVALAFLGGLVLNLMPCVLPVLALKLLALADLARRGPREAVPHAAAYAAGVGASMLAFAVLVVGLRAAGSAVGWGFQFREPAFLAVLAALLVVLAANLFGVFEIGGSGGRLAALGTSAAGARRSFFDGLLTVVLATPCSAPFLGTAAGFAFASPAPVVIAIFLAIGAGLALPLSLVALAPAAAGRLPRPGPWMLELRAGLGFVLLGAAAWLLWVLGRQLDVDGMARVLTLLLGIGFATWVYGRLQGRGRAPRPAWLAVAGVAILAAGLGLWRPGTADPGVASEPYDPLRIAHSLDEGRPVFAYFTADWCLTCKVNERFVLADERVRARLDRHDFAVFEADWTRRDEFIRTELARLGRSGVPVYVLYAPGDGGRPRLLPEVLTVGRFVEALDEAAAPRGRTVTSSPAVGSMQPGLVASRRRSS